MVAVREPEAELLGGELVLRGRVMPASNATFVGEVCGTTVVYKPVAGERPLWDFPDGTLAARERAAYLVSEALGWNVVPLTFLRDGPHGPGMVQVWQEPDDAEDAVTVVRDLRERPGWLHVFDGVDDRDHDVALVHEDSSALRRMAVFDVAVNNADRKGGHVLPMAGGHRYGVDHGVSFHTDPKLRTVLWGWAGSPLAEEEVAGLHVLADALDEELAEALVPLLTAFEIEATRRRVARLLRVGRAADPAGGLAGDPVAAVLSAAWAELARTRSGAQVEERSGGRSAATDARRVSKPGEMTDNRNHLRQTFDSVAAAYADARPTYPPELLDALVGATGIGPESLLLEVGCGPGVATLPLAALGCRIVAVELGAGLASDARRRLAAYPRVSVVTASFETYPPGEPAFDLVYAATAWHWVDPAVRYRRAHAVLRPGGHLAFWSASHLVPLGGDPFFREIQDVYDEIGEGVPDGHVWLGPGDLPEQTGEIEASGLFGVTLVRHVDWETTYDADSYLALLDTFSGHIAMEEAKRAHLYAEIRRRLALRPDGLLRRHWGAVLHVAARLG